MLFYRVFPFLRGERVRGLLRAAAIWISGLSAGIGPVIAQTDPGADTLRVYDLGEIVIHEGEAPPVTPATVHRIALARLDRVDAATVDGVLRLIPGAYLQTNTRGETLVYLRNAGERQTALYFDGALLNVPWDNRFDVSLLPAGVLGSVSVTSGVPSVLYGGNVGGGVVSMVTRTLGSPGGFTEMMGQLGTLGLRHGNLTHLGQRGRISYAAAGGFAARDAAALPAGVDLPFSQESRRSRTNTDFRLLNGFAQGAYETGAGTRIGLTALVLDGEKGTAPEGHLDPAVSTVRFWRYPVWRNDVLILNTSGGGSRAGNGAWRGTVWVNRFRQHIDQYRAADYALRARREENRDLTFGMRLVYRRPLGPDRMNAALNGLDTRHRQRDLVYEADGALAPYRNPLGVEEPYPEPVYRQQLLSAGLEYELRRWQAVHFILGGSLDALRTPETGDKPARPDQLSFGLLAGGIADLRPGLALKASLGRKVRFPTLRELFGEALGRFLVNPDLKPEVALLAEGGLSTGGERLSAGAVAFVNRTRHTIDQRVVEVNGKRLRQRVNLQGSRVYGLELTGAARPVPPLRLEGHLLWTHARASGTGARLAEKPDLLGTLSAGYGTGRGLSVAGDLVYTGRAYSLDETNRFEPLAPSAVLNGRLAFQVFSPGKPTASAELFLRINNLTNALTLPQLGLPGPGRTVQGGLKVAF